MEGKIKQNNDIKIAFTIEMQVSGDKVIVKSLDTEEMPLDLGCDILKAVNNAVKVYYLKRRRI